MLTECQTQGVRINSAKTSMNKVGYKVTVAPSRGRGLKHPATTLPVILQAVAPSRGRGLKHPLRLYHPRQLESPLHGGVD